MTPFFETALQGWIFLWTVYAGILLGIWYDFLRPLRKGALVYVADVLLLLPAIPIAMKLMAVAGQDRFRLFILIGFGCGFLLYVFGLRRLVLWVFFLLKKKKTAGNTTPVENNKSM